jgi:2-hydroxycyclohexanecarboxyl-CoA dehydrogenase
MKLKRKAAIVTGGASGIGRATALALSLEGANVAIADIAVDNANRVRDEVAASGYGSAIACPVDLTKRVEVEAMVQTVLREFGQIDILVNCAGWDRLEPFVESSEETWDKILTINFKSVLHTVKAVLPHMMERGSGKIINIASDAGRVGSSWEAVYSGAKAR